MKKILVLIVSVLFCFLVGFVSSRIQMDSLLNWYPTLNRSPLNPPGYVFPIVWSFLYLCMGLSVGFIILSESTKKVFLVRIFLTQLFLNFAWSLSFFYLQSPFLALIDVILLLIFIVIYAIKSYPVLKVSSCLFVPYILWVMFATYLTFYVYVNN